MLRWWDGVRWSEPAWPEYAENVAAQKAAMPMAENPQFIKWTCQWWVPASKKEMLKEVVLHHRDQLAELRDFKAASAQAAEAAKAMIAAQASWYKLLQRVGVPA